MEWPLSGVREPLATARIVIMNRWIGAALVAASLVSGSKLRAADEPGPSTRASGIDKANADPSVRPQDDLFRHVNGVWLAKTEIPAERAYYGSFIQLDDRAQADIRTLVEVAAKSDSPKGSDARKVGDLYSSFMDDERIERLGFQPIADHLADVDAIKDRAGLLHTLARLERAGLDGPFRVFVETDAKKSDQYILYLNQGGLGLPDESYYRDPKFESVRAAYVAHVARMFELIHQPDPKAAAAQVMALETRLAKAHWDRVKNRDSTLTYNKKTIEALDTLAPHIGWSGWLGTLGATGVHEVIVRQPEFFTAAARALAEVPLDEWKAWLRWNVIREYASLLSKPFVEEHFDFYERTLTGATALRPRWKRGVLTVEGALGFAVGRLYVEKHFPPAARERMKELVDNLIAAYRDDIEALDWMSPETKKKALLKLSKFTPKIGYPTQWRDYGKLEITRDDLVRNMRRAATFELDRLLGKLGKPVDRSEWHMTPQTVNAYYNPGMNEIVFPAAILQPPFFSLEADDAVNYGGIGAVIGHEIGHGFDDQGSKFDGDGNMNDWWTTADRREFEARAKRLIAQYDGFAHPQAPDLHVNGALTIGENIGDLGGLTIASKAYKRSLRGKKAPVIDGLTGEQRLFIGWAQVWRSKYRDAEVKRRLTVDPHSPPMFRCNGVVRNLPEFYEAFGVKEGDKLWLPADQRVRIW
jgi:putative endopeptidase